MNCNIPQTIDIDAVEVYTINIKSKKLWFIVFFLGGGDMQTERTCCFVGHRTIEERAEWKTTLCEILERMVTEQGIDTFLFGSKSRFNDVCYEIVTHLKEKYSHIQRVYVRGEFPHIEESYRRYIAEKYEDTYYPERILHAGKAVYIERNREMIDRSRWCVIYYDEKCAPAHRNSGTKAALAYAVHKGKEIVRFPV